MTVKPMTVKPMTVKPMTVKLGVIMDPIASIAFAKDSTLAMLLAAKQRGWTLYYMEMDDLYWRDGTAWARMRQLSVADDPSQWFALGAESTTPLATLDVILMRKDPPFNMEFIYATYLLERAEEAGVLVVNKPSGLRDCNEKLFTACFPECCPATLISRSKARFRAFLDEHRDIIIKPLDGMGGSSVFRVRHGDDNVNVILEVVTQQQRCYVMGQRYLSAISEGDKRLLMIDGEPIEYVLARIPSGDDPRGNLAAGAVGVGQPINAAERRIAAAVGPALRRKGILFAGLDIIGSFLTEINVTSPTCIRELEKQFPIHIADRLMHAIERHLTRK